jgi:hypothetical protein
MNAEHSRNNLLYFYRVFGMRPFFRGWRKRTLREAIYTARKNLRNFVIYSIAVGAGR